MEKMDNFIKTLQQFCLDFKAWKIDKRSVRFLVLFLAAVIGVIFGIGFNCISGLFIYLGFSQEVINSLTIVVIGVFVFIALWYFRTRDVRQQIEKAQTQIFQKHFNDAFTNLASHTRTRVEVGAKLLTELSETTPAFNNKIKIAFMERLKYFPFNKKNTIKDIPLNYGKEILTWLFVQYPDEKDLRRIELSYQDLSKMIFDDCDLTNAKFKNAKLELASFKNTELKFADFENATITPKSFENAKNVELATFSESDTKRLRELGIIKQ